jgi:transcriptional regulator with XRE-family HTH domain
MTEVTEVRTRASGTRRSLLRTRREAAGLSREKLAALAGCSGASIQNYENGYRPSAEMAQKLADALGCKPSDLQGNR